MVSVVLLTIVEQTSLLRQATMPHLLLALLLGLCIGAERQWRQRAAGLRTNTLVCLGAAAFVDLGLAVAPNTTQVIAYVVSGVGFLGAGAIMKDGGSVRGLNTAATLWCSAAVGACAGAGRLLDAVFVTLLLVGVNSVLRPVSNYIDRRSLALVSTHILYRLRATCETADEGVLEAQLTRAIAEHALVLREMHTDEIEGTETSRIHAVLQATSPNAAALEELAATARSWPVTETADWTEMQEEAE